jgi:sulfate/thiosulfate transport system permease protein
MASRFHQPSVLPGFGLTFGFTTFFLSALVLLPLAALVVMAGSMHWTDFLHVVTSARALGSYRLSFGASLLAASINLVFGFILAWSLVRYEFPARKLVDALIDMPFALPTAVSGIALTLIGMPFMVRTLQPALAEVQRDLEDAAETLGAGRAYVLRRIILPTVLPAMLTGFTLAFARAVGEYGSVIFIAGNLPMKTEITPLLIVIHLQEFDYRGAAALGAVMLVMSFIVLLTINLIHSWGRRRMVASAR